MSINIHVNLSVSVADAVSVSANFGTPMIVAEHSITANRQDGPYSSLQAVSDAGFTLAAAPTIYNWAARVFAQNPRTSQVMVGRRLASEGLHTTMPAIAAADPASWYLTCIDTNTANDIMALANWTESQSKVALVQTSSSDMLSGTASAAQVSTFTFGGTPTDGTYSIEVINAWTGESIGTASVVRSGGTPATDNDLATAMRSAWDGVAGLAAISAPAAGTGADVEITFDGLGNGYEFVLTAPAPGTLVESTPAFVQNPGQLLSGLAYDRTALLYHDDDTEYLDAALASRCLAFNLDAPDGAGSWSYHRFSGITATTLTDAQKSTLLGYNCNYYAPVKYTSGVEDPGFSFPGQMASGRFIDVTTTQDWLQARMEEALLGVLTHAASTSRPRIPYTNAGLARLQAAAQRVMNLGVTAGHFAANTESSTTGRQMPYIDVPKVEDVSAADKAARRVIMSGEAGLAGAVNSVGDSATIGLTIDLQQ